MTKRLLALDTATMYYRAFHGVPSTLKAPDGTVINALRGTLDALAVLIEQYSPDQVVAAWDEQWRPTWRVQLLPEYKAHRVKPGTENDEDIPPELAPQIPLVAQALALLGIQVIGQPDQEADDVLGLLTAHWSGETLVVTGDRDLFQLVDDAKRISVVYTGAGMKNLQVIDDVWLHNKYGLGPGQYLDFAALRGDASDGLPGVPGIGDKTAAKLLTEFNDVAGIIAAAESGNAALSARIQANVLAARDYLTAVKSVIAVGQQTSLPPIAEQGAPDAEEFHAFAERWGLGRPAERALKAVLSISEGS